MDDIQAILDKTTTAEDRQHVLLMMLEGKLDEMTSIQASLCRIAGFLEKFKEQIGIESDNLG